jgi:hypothetical protein
MAEVPPSPNGLDPHSPAPDPADTGPDRRRQTLIASLRERFALAQSQGDAQAKQALFREAVYLNLPPELWQDPPA